MTDDLDDLIHDHLEPGRLWCTAAGQGGRTAPRPVRGAAGGQGFAS
jgi:hypothetical protein